MADEVVHRVVTFKYAPGVTDQQKRVALDGMVKLYLDLGHLLASEPITGRNNDSQGMDHGYDFAMVVDFKSKAARDAFGKDPLHDAYKATLGGIAADCLVYDFIKGDHEF